MQTTHLMVPASFEARIRGQVMTVDPREVPEHVALRVFEYGLQQMLNDAAASAKDEAEAMAKAEARWDNMTKGILRASPNRESDPVAKEAKKIAEGILSRHKAYIGWLQENGLKAGSKEGKAKLAELVAELAKKDNILAQAKLNVEANKGLEIEIEI